MERGDGPWLASRKTFFEHWVILRLSEAMTADPKLADALPIALSQGCHLREGTLHYPLGKSRSLNHDSRRVIERLAAAGEAGLSRQQLRDAGLHDAETERLLDVLLQKKVLVQGFGIAPGRDEPLASLERALRSLPLDEQVVKPWCELLQALEHLRLQFAGGDLDVRIQALDSMRRVLADAGIDLSRERGQMYVGRFPVYEDCGRNLCIELGGSVLAAMEGPMTSVMQAYSWLAGAAAVRLHDRYLACWRELQDGAGALDFLKLLATLQQRDFASAVTAELREILRECWTEVAGHGVAQPHIEVGSVDLQRLLSLLHRREPRAGATEVLGVELHSPDFLIAGESEEAVQRGDYTLVIGEVHPAVHTVSQPVAQPFCPNIAGIRDEVTRLLAPHALVVADSAATYQRSHIDWVPVPPLTRVRLPDAGVPQEAGPGLPAGRGEVVLRDGWLRYRDRETQVEDQLLTVLPSEMHRVCFSLAAEVLGQSLSARLTCERIVLKRRSWQLQPEDLPASMPPADSFEGFVAWRRWATERGLPRHVFVKSAGEPKPVYVDFSSPQSLDLLATLLKKPEPIRISEMSPAPRELWLRERGGAYCCEFRTSFGKPRQSTREHARTLQGNEDHDSDARASRRRHADAV